VVPITTLRPGTVIKDDAIPLLLRQVRDPVFVTINTTDFWGRIAASQSYCIVCLPLPDDRVDELPDLLRRLFRLPDFKSKRARRGKVVLVSAVQVRFYQAGDPQVHQVDWQEPLGRGR
jgi:hypothetical protein